MYVARKEWDLFARVIGLEGNDSRLLVRYYFCIVTVGVVALFSSLSLSIFFKTKLLLSIPIPRRTVCSFTRVSDSIPLSPLNLSYPAPCRVVHGYLLAYIYLNRVTSTRTQGGLSSSKLPNRTLSILCPRFLLRWRVSFHFTARNCLETRRHSVLKSHARTCRPQSALMGFVFFHLFCTTLLLGLSSLPRVARASRCEFCNDQCVEDCTRGNR